MTKCEHCDANILSTSQPIGATPWHQEPSDDEKIGHAEQTLAANRMGTTPEMQKMYDEFGGEPLADATIELNGLLDKYWMGDNSKTNIIAMCAAQQKCKNALAATPAVGGDALADMLDQRATVHEYAYNTGSGDTYRSDAKLMREASTALRAQPASPLRGREDHEALAKMVYEAVRFANWAAGEGFSPAPDCEEAIDPAIILSDCINAVEHFDGDDWNRLAGIASDAILASPPEQPAAEIVSLDKARLVAAYEAYWANSSGTYTSIECAILSYLNSGTPE